MTSRRNRALGDEASARARRQRREQIMLGAEPRQILLQPERYPFVGGIDSQPLNTPHKTGPIILGEDVIVVSKEKVRNLLSPQGRKRMREMEMASQQPLDSVHGGAPVAGRGPANDRPSASFNSGVHSSSTRGFEGSQSFAMKGLSFIFKPPPEQKLPNHGLVEEEHVLHQRQRRRIQENGDINHGVDVIPPSFMPPPRLPPTTHHEPTNELRLPAATEGRPRHAPTSPIAVVQRFVTNAVSGFLSLFSPNREAVRSKREERAPPPSLRGPRPLPSHEAAQTPLSDLEVQPTGEGTSTLAAHLESFSFQEPPAIHAGRDSLTERLGLLSPADAQARREVDEARWPSPLAEVHCGPRPGHHLEASGALDPGSSAQRDGLGHPEWQGVETVGPAADWAAAPLSLNHDWEAQSFDMARHELQIRQEEKQRRQFQQWERQQSFLRATRRPSTTKKQAKKKGGISGSRVLDLELYSLLTSLGAQDSLALGRQGYSSMADVHRRLLPHVRRGEGRHLTPSAVMDELVRPHAGATLRRGVWGFPSADVGGALAPAAAPGPQPAPSLPKEEVGPPVWKTLLDGTLNLEGKKREEVRDAQIKMAEEEFALREGTMEEARRHSEQRAARRRASGDSDIEEVVGKTVDLDAYYDRDDGVEEEVQLYDGEEEEEYDEEEEDEEEEEGEEEGGEVEKAVPSLVPFLSEEANEEVDAALTYGNDAEELINNEASGMTIHRKDIRCLLPGGWLNDEVINLYLHLLKDRETRAEAKYPTCHFFNSFFYAKCMQLSDNGRGYNYKSVKRWTRKNLIGYSIKDCDKVIVPVHLGIHWVLAVINIREKQFVYMDSLKGGGMDCLKRLAQYIVDEIKDKSQETWDVSDWTFVERTDIPTQLNTFDCGMFMLKFADYESRDAPLTFRQADMPLLRRYMVWELLCQHAN